MARFKLELTPTGLYRRGSRINDAIKGLSTSAPAEVTSNAIKELKSSYYDLSGGEVYNTLSKKIKPVNTEGLKLSVTELSNKLNAMESIPMPKAADIGNITVRKAIEATLKNDSFAWGTYSDRDTTSSLIKIFDEDELDKVLDIIIPKISRELLTESILNGSDWGEVGLRDLSHDQWFDRVVAEMAKEGIENKSPLVVKNAFSSTVTTLAGRIKKESAKDISRLHVYGEREVFIKKTCERLLENRSNSSLSIAEKSLFSKSDKYGRMTEAKTLGSMPVKEMKKHIQGCADFFGGYVPMIRFERSSKRGKAGIDKGEFVISVGSNTDRNTVWHEIAHHTDRSLPWISVLTKEYLVRKYRDAAADQKIARLRDLTGIRGYKPHEIAINNNSSPDFYVLKLYNEDINLSNTDHEHVISQIRNVRSSEVFSMGAGYMADGSLHECSHDADFVSTVLTIVERLQKEGKEWGTL